MQFYLIVILSFFFAADVSHPAVESVAMHEADKEFESYVLRKVNRIRTSGCFCGRKYMPPTEELQWDDTLFKSAMKHAKEMTRYNYFSHFSKNGDDIGDRLEAAGYNWQVAGENLGEGQKNFDEVLDDWLDSKSHCKMLMNPKVTEMAVANHGRFWVQHFGKPMPAGAVKRKR